MKTKIFQKTKVVQTQPKDSERYFSQDYVDIVHSVLQSVRPLRVLHTRESIKSLPFFYLGNELRLPHHPCPLSLFCVDEMKLNIKRNWESPFY